MTDYTQILMLLMPKTSERLSGSCCNLSHGLQLLAYKELIKCGHIGSDGS